MKRWRFSIPEVLFFICIAAISAGTTVKALADKPDRDEGIVNVGDRVIFFSDNNNDGFFEKNVALVIDDVPTTARINGTPIVFGNLVNLQVFPSFESGVAAPFRVRNVARGRSVGEYESLVSSNH